MSARVMRVAMVNGTSALHLALLVAGVRPGEEVLVSNLTFIAPANAIRYAGAWPVFIGSERDALADRSGEGARIPRHAVASAARTVCHSTEPAADVVRALVAVHILGHPGRSRAAARRSPASSVALIEDCAESDRHGISRAASVGTFGAALRFQLQRQQGDHLRRRRHARDQRRRRWRESCGTSPRRPSSDPLRIHSRRGRVQLPAYEFAGRRRLRADGATRRSPATKAFPCRRLPLRPCRPARHFRNAGGPPVWSIDWLTTMLVIPPRSAWIPARCSATWPRAACKRAASGSPCIFRPPIAAPSFSGAISAPSFSRMP